MTSIARRPQFRRSAAQRILPSRVHQLTYIESKSPENLHLQNSSELVNESETIATFSEFPYSDILTWKKSQMLTNFGLKNQNFDTKKSIFVF